MHVRGAEQQQQQRGKDTLQVCLQQPSHQTPGRHPHTLHAPAEHNCSVQPAVLLVPHPLLPFHHHPPPLSPPAMSPPDHTDVQAAENFMVFQYAWIADPLYFGDYPLVRGEGGGAD